MTTQRAVEERLWRLNRDPGAFRTELEGRFGLSPVAAAVLASRLDEPSIDAAERFLNPRLTDLLPAWDLEGMRPAADRLARALRGKERVIVHGDYDADGVTACALLVRVCQALGHAITPYIPSRMEEGYGLSDAFVRTALAESADLVVTVDCGIHEGERIGELMSGGVDVVVTDHHEPGGVAPPHACAVIDPKLPGSRYGFPHLAGVGIAFKLAWAVCETMAGSAQVGPTLREALLGVLPLVALGTVADVAPLVGENRILVRYGLQSMLRPGPGLAALLEVAGATGRPISVRTLSHQLAPRINAAGRMGLAERALALLLEEEPARAAEQAEELDRENRARQKLCQELQAEAEDLLAREDSHDRAAIVVAREHWHEGVVGIVANRLVEAYGRPAAVIALDPETGIGKGSARSLPGIDLYAALERAGEHLVQFGGHELAAGFQLRADSVPAFGRALSEACDALAGGRTIRPELAVDAGLPLPAATAELHAELARLAPFGERNPEPCFLAAGVTVPQPARTFGNGGRHFSFSAAQGGAVRRAVAFGRPEWLPLVERSGARLDIVYALQMNDYYRPARLELRVVDLRPA